MEAVWRQIPDFPGYEINERCEVRSNRAGRSGSPVTPRTEPTGYVRFGLMRDGKQVWRFAHRMIWQAFVAEIPDGLVINHKNGVKDDNRLCNLEVVTISENSKHAYRVLGIKPHINPDFGEKNGFSKLSADIIAQIRKRRADEGLTYAALGAEFSINKATAHRICTGKAWRHI